MDIKFLVWKNGASTMSFEVTVRHLPSSLAKCDAFSTRVPALGGGYLPKADCNYEIHSQSLFDIGDAIAY